MPTGSPTKPDRLSSRGVYRIPRHRVELGGRDEVLQGRQCDLINRDSKIYFAPGSQYLSQIGIGAGVIEQRLRRREHGDLVLARHRERGAIGSTW